MERVKQEEHCQSCFFPERLPFLARGLLFISTISKEKSITGALLMYVPTPKASATELRK